MSAHRQVEAAGRKRQLLGITLLEADRESALSRLAARLGEHRRREIDAGDAMPAPGKFQAQEAGAAADIERVEPIPTWHHEGEDTIPGSALGRRRDAVAEALIEPGRAPVPMRGDLPLDGIARGGGHQPSPAISASASTCSA